MERHRRPNAPCATRRLSAEADFLNPSGLRARICVPSCAVVQMRSRLVRGTGCDVRRPPPSTVRRRLRESIVFFHTDTLAKSPHRHAGHTYPRARTHVHNDAPEVRARERVRVSSTTTTNKHNHLLFLRLLLLLLLLAASRH